MINRKSKVVNLLVIIIILAVIHSHHVLKIFFGLLLISHCSYRQP